LIQFSDRTLATARRTPSARLETLRDHREFELIVARDVTRHRLLDGILRFFGGRAQPMMAQLAEAGKLTRARTFASWKRRSRGASGDDSSYKRALGGLQPIA
jgi:hypothetical protein